MPSKQLFETSDRTHLFNDPVSAGRLLASNAMRYTDTNVQPSLVLAISRGAVPLAWEMAKALTAPMDILPIETFYVRNEAVAAVSLYGITLFDQQAMLNVGVTRDQLHVEINKLRPKLLQMTRQWLAHSNKFPLTNRTVLLVDDVAGMNGSAWLGPNRCDKDTRAQELMFTAAIAALQKSYLTGGSGPAKLVLVTPVASHRFWNTLVGDQSQQGPGVTMRLLAEDEEWIDLGAGEQRHRTVSHALGEKLVVGNLGKADDVVCVYAMPEEGFSRVSDKLGWYRNHALMSDADIDTILTKALGIGYILPYRGTRQAEGGESIAPLPHLQ